jgi:hypothetical protein
MHANCPPESGGQRHRVLCDDERGGSSNEVSQNAFLTSSTQEPPPARSRLRRDRAALLTKEGSFGTSLETGPLPTNIRNLSTEAFGV